MIFEFQDQNMSCPALFGLELLKRLETGHLPVSIGKPALADVIPGITIALRRLRTSIKGAPIFSVDP
jgi:hypothetical protein